MLETFTHPVTLADIATGVVDARVTMPEDLLPEFARMLGVLSIESVIGSFTLAEGEAGDVDLSGDVVAHLTQRCVVTLEPIAQIVRERVEIRFVRGSVAAMPDDQDVAHDVMPLEGDMIDLAAIVVETVALGLDPYPGAAFEAVVTDRDSGRESPFAALERLKSGSET